MKVSISYAVLLTGALAQASILDLFKRADNATTILSGADTQIQTVNKVVQGFDGSEDSRDDLASAGAACVGNLTVLSKQAAALDPLTDAQGASLQGPAVSLQNSTKAFLDSLDAKLDLFEKDEICGGIMDALKLIEGSLVDVFGNVTTKATQAVQDGANMIIKSIKADFQDTYKLLKGCPPPKTKTSDSAMTPTPTPAASATAQSTPASTTTAAKGGAGQLVIPPMGIAIVFAFCMI